MFQYATLEDTVYLFFAANDTAGSGGDGATPAFDVRLAGAAASAAPVLSGTPDLLSHANYPAGCHEVAVAATAANGFAAGNVYAVFCTLAIDSQNPTGFVGAFALAPVLANVKEIDDDANAAILLALSAAGMLTGTFTGTPTTTQAADSARTEASDDHFIGSLMIFLGTENTRAAYRRSPITDYVGATKTFTFEEIPTAPNAGDAYIIL